MSALYTKLTLVMWIFSTHVRNLLDPKGLAPNIGFRVTPVYTIQNLPIITGNGPKEAANPCE